MITDGFTYVAVIVFFAGVVVWAEKVFKGTVFRYVPAVVIIYFGTMLLSTCGLWEKTDDVNVFYHLTKKNLLPVMIFLMLLRCDVRKIMTLGPRMLLGFFTASLSIVLGFVIVYGSLKGMYEPDTWRSFAALSGSWMGGTGNMVAIQEALHVPGGKMGYVLLMDSVNYAIWVMALLALIPFAPLFNKWTKSDTTVLDQIGRYLNDVQEKVSRHTEFPDLMVLIGTGLLISALSMYLAGKLPTTVFITPTAWTVIMVTIAGIVCGMTPLARVPGSSQLSNAALYVLVGLIGSRANFAELTQAPLYIISGFLIIGIHAVILALAAKVFKLDLFTCAVASLANIGGVASAPILAAAYSKALIPVGVLMAMLGYIVGTGGGLLVGKLLSLL
jgi:uncharacterized membrane protein